MKYKPLSQGISINSDTSWARQWAAIDPVGALTVGPCVKQVEVYGEYLKLADDNERMREAMKRVKGVGYNEECIFCGLKDAATRKGLEA